jgi:hypothetical protein
MDRLEELRSSKSDTARRKKLIELHSHLFAGAAARSMDSFVACETRIDKEEPWRNWQVGS